MRLLSVQGKLWHKRRAIDECQRKTRKEVKIFKEKSSLGGYERFSAPEKLSLLDAKHRRKVLGFIVGIRNRVISGKRKIFVDLTPAKAFASGATIMILAELMRLKHAFPDLKFRSSCPRNSKAAQVVKQTGLAKILRTSVKAKVKDHDVVYWKCAAGQQVLGQRCDEILGPYNGVIAEALSDHLYRGLTEAMTNAHHHAYLDQRGDGINLDLSYRPWWMFSQEKDGLLNVVFCDLGLGIPATLPIRHEKWWGYVKRFGLDLKGEGKLIQGAVRNSQSRTRKLHRGKGLRQIAETVNSAPKGRVHIFSNHGLYTLEGGVENTYDYNESIMGTVIQWRMPLPVEHQA